MNYFSDALLANRARVVSMQPIPKMPGAYQIKYQLPALDPKTGKPTATFRNKVHTKTVYDPSQISDIDFFNRGLQAANDPAKIIVYKDGRPRQWRGFDSQGVRWRGYYSPDGKITTFFPDHIQ